MKNFALAFAICVSAALTVVAQQFSKDNLKRHIETLASDEYEGRGSGSAGEEKAAVYIEQQFSKLKLKPLGTNQSYRQPFVFKGGQHGTGGEIQSKNVVAFLDNGASNTVVIGAHYDHLGIGNDGSSLDANPKGKIHNGADDNASGVAAVLELARYYQTNKIKENNNFLFICFSGEEFGLHGSKYFTENPTLELSKVNYMINLDMVGRYDASKGLAVTGTGTSPGWEPTLKKLAGDKMSIKTDSSGVGPSDHTSFYLKNIPVLHFFTGAHSDYHKPTDDSDKINYEGEVEILNLVANLVKVNDDQPKLAFLKTKNRSTTGASSFKVTMGVMPSYSSSEAGLKVDGVTEGKPAAKAGIVTGDLITQIGEHEIKDIQSYMKALGKFEKGQTVPVKVKRGTEELMLSVTF